jgi:hypothetical protein
MATEEVDLTNKTLISSVSATRHPKLHQGLAIPHDIVHSRTCMLERQARRTRQRECRVPSGAAWVSTGRGIKAMGLQQQVAEQERAIQSDDCSPECIPSARLGSPTFAYKSPGSRSGSRCVLSWRLSPAVQHAASRVSDDSARDHCTWRLAGRHLARTTGHLALHRPRTQTHLQRTEPRRQSGIVKLLACSDLRPRSCALLRDQATSCCRTLIRTTVASFRCLPSISSRAAVPLASPPPMSIAAPPRARGDPDSAGLDRPRLILAATREWPPEN